METLSTMPLSSTPAAGRRRVLGAFQYAAIAARPRRVLSLLILLWILNLFDLSYTILAHQIGGFEELNPLARSLLRPSWILVAFKMAAVTLGTGILMVLRRRGLAEAVCWGLCLIYTALAFTWMTYFSILR